MRRNRWLVAGAGVVISLIFLWLAFRNLHPEQVWENIRQADALLLLAAALWFFVSLVLIALRWKFLLNAAQRISVRKLSELVSIGYAGNNIYPFRSGEVLRILLLQRNHGVPVVRGTTTVVVERVLDGLVMLTFVLIPLQISDISSPEVQTVASIAAPVFLVALVVFFVLAARPNLLRQLYSIVSRVLPKKLDALASRLMEEFIMGLEGLRSPVDLAGTIISSYASWLLHAGVYWLVALAFNLNMSWPTLLLVVGVVNLAGLIPASPGQFGVFESLTAAVLVASGVAEAQAVAYALSAHMVIWLPVTLLGLFFLLQQGLNFSSITRAGQMEQNVAG
jgi:uncharacterized protein (TIRG00374 family)